MDNSASGRLRVSTVSCALFSTLFLVIFTFLQYKSIIQYTYHANRILMDTVSNESYIDSIYENQHNITDWFDASKWMNNTLASSLCPYKENMCMYQQQYRVWNEIDEFHLKNEIELIGDGMPNWIQSVKIYKQLMRSTVWNINTTYNEFEHANCKYNKITNHMIIHSAYSTMLGEWYARSLIHLFYLQQNELIERDLQLYLLIGDQVPLFTSHHLFIELFTDYQLQHFTDMFNHNHCICYHRLFFCGFEMHNNTLIPNRELLRTVGSWSRNSIKNTLYPKLIDAYHGFIESKDIHLERDVIEYKQQQLFAYFGKNFKTSYLKKIKFIGLYQRRIRRSWINVEQIQLHCNDRYFKVGFFCHIITLEDFLHARDVVIMHKASNMLIGVHGAQLTDSIWMNDGSYIIELLPFNGPEWVTTVDIPTPVGVIFKSSKYFHVGLKLSEKSRPPEYYDEYYALDSDFTVDWNRLSKVIEFLLLDEGGVCHQQNNSHNSIIIPTEIKQMGFGIYNNYCV